MQVLYALVLRVWPTCNTERSAHFEAALGPQDRQATRQD